MKVAAAGERIAAVAEGRGQPASDRPDRRCGVGERAPPFDTGAHGVEPVLDGAEDVAHHGEGRVAGAEGAAEHGAGDARLPSPAI